MHAQLLQSCPTVCDPMDCSLLGSSVHGFPRQEYQSGVPLPPPGDLPDPVIKPASPVTPVLAGGFFATSATQEAPMEHFTFYSFQVFFKEMPYGVSPNIPVTLKKIIWFQFLLFKLHSSEFHKFYGMRKELRYVCVCACVRTCIFFQNE